jgi:hypothetical protein|tara:strand:+ start:12539 stop:12883 length:345 start_codon:yes stop_codon:yes gene_type:complete
MSNDSTILYLKLTTGEDVVGYMIYSDDFTIHIQDALQVVKNHIKDDRYSYFMKEWMAFADDNIVTISRCNIVAQSNGSDDLLRFYFSALREIVHQELKEATTPHETIPEGMVKH